MQHCSHFSSAPAECIGGWSLLQCCMLTVQPSAEPGCIPTCHGLLAARSCECYHGLSRVTTGYHSALCPRNSFNPPLAFPAHRSQDALVCNQSVRRTPLWVAHVARGGHGRGFSQSNISSARRNVQVSHCNCLMVTPSLPSCHLQYQCGQEVNLMLSGATRS